ncbi:hypothetical protein GGTG_05700 [Gaeumannomyces tritici R3-111a-1]|uniref:Uncharacterized protein n=1 Tax=Gaeumannomyces tritici (strain R3-111a-1) TaxID=644352 RepID=J3NWN8_GAET3|nr:hypothetical protein GGTG_05700 [Gaeumannomyces tritici R3-111a-1]EJT75770.1 hypothetical protein GGTG_05700 [Gaeumannomyces tritici R3-111a-1]
MYFGTATVAKVALTVALASQVAALPTPPTELDARQLPSSSKPWMIGCLPGSGCMARAKAGPLEIPKCKRGVAADKEADEAAIKEKAA